MTNKFKTNVFIHTIEDVEYFFKEIYKVKIKYILYVTHAGVMEYIKEYYGFGSILLSSLKTQAEINDIIKQVEKLSINIINSLDKKYSHAISKQFDIKNINFFLPLYSYHLPYILSGLFVFKELLIKLDNGNENIVFDYGDSFFNAVSLKSFLDLSMINSNINISWYRSNKKEKKKNIIIRIVKNLDKVYYRLIEIFFEYKSYISIKKKNILYMEELYDLRFIKKNNQFRLIPYAMQALKHKFTIVVQHDSQTSDLSKIFKINTKNIVANDIESFIAIFLKKDFLKKSKDYYTGLKTLDNLIKVDKVDLAIWGSPPVNGFKALFYEYCKVKKIKVIGMQHGASYVDQNYQKHYYSDFMRCDKYISYGFTQEDFENNFKGINYKNIKIHSFGTTKLYDTISTAKTKTVDVLFPVTNSISIFDGGLSRSKPDIIHGDQVEILDILEEESKDNITSLVKPFMNTNIWQTSVFYKLKKLQFAKVEWNKTLTDTLNETNVKCVIIEFMSTPLYEVLSYDIEIFLFVREADNLTDKARKMLEKRVHIVKDFKEFEINFKKWLVQKLPQKRNSEYYNYYVKKENTKENIITLIKSL